MRVLLLAGTAEARELAARLAGAGVKVIASLAGVTDRPATLAVPTRIGGFGGVEGMVDFLHEHAITHIIDATHPFAVHISANAAEAGKRCDISVLQVVRPAWPEKKSWTIVPDLPAAARALPRGASVFLATGRGSLQHFADRADVRFLARVIDDRPGEFPLPQGEFLVGKPPFSVQEEATTLTRHGIEVLVARNSGGTGGIEKVIAAEHLGIGVVMVARPDLPKLDRVTSVEAALTFVEETWTSA